MAVGLLGVALLTVACSLSHDDVRVPYAVGSSGVVETSGDVSIRVTIDAISESVTSDFANPEVGFHFMVIELTLDNVGEKETGGGSFILRTDNGFEYRDKFFGNARTVRNVVLETIKNQSLRLATALTDKSNPQELDLIDIADVREFKLDTDGFVFNKKSIGFRSKES